MEGHSILCYNKIMSNILLIGKDFPDSLDFAEGLAQGGNLIFTSQK